MEKLEEFVFDQKESLFIKYRMLYYLRNRRDEKAVESLCKFLNKKNIQYTGNLFRHEVCFVLGQISENAQGALQ